MTKSDFNYDEQGRAILGSAKEMAAWVELGFEEQDKRKILDEPFYKHYIDLCNCVLYISYPIDSKEPQSQIFNLCDMAGVVPGIEKIEDDPNYLFEVKLDIHLEGSILYGNFFHYVKFDGMVRMDDTTINNTFSCFKCLFNGYVFMQGIRLDGGYSFEQCYFNKGLLMSSAVVGSINAEFGNCLFKECLSLAAAGFTKQTHSNPIELRNSTVDNLNISNIRTDGIPFYIQDTTIHGMKMDNLKMDGTLGFYSCDLDGIVTSVIDEESTNNHIKELLLHSCNVKAQCHIENSDIEKVAITFGRIEDSGRLRLSQCNVGEFVLGSSSILGLMDFFGNTITSISMEESCVPGYLNFQGNDVKEFKDRQTLRLLKNEAIKVNDKVAAMQLYAKEMKLLLSDESVSKGDKVSLWLNKAFSNFGQNWIKALLVTLMLSMTFTLLMLGIGSRIYQFNLSGEFIGVGTFVTALLDSINVFSIPLFSETIEKYGLNVFGQILYFVIKPGSGVWILASRRGIQKVRKELKYDAG